MRRARLFWHLYPLYLLVTVLCLLLAGWVVALTLKRFHSEQTASDLEARAVLLATQAAAFLQSGERDGIEDYCKKTGKRIGTRITVILPSGKVIADSHHDPATMDNHADRPEIIEAFRRGKGMSVRHSHTLDEDMMYVAVPVVMGGKPAAIVRTSKPLTAINQALAGFWKKAAAGGAAVALLAALLCFLAVRRISKPLEALTQEVQNYAEGGKAKRLHQKGSYPQEFAILIDALNGMTAELERRMRTVEAHREELQAVLSGMLEGVLAIDAEGKIFMLNRSAAALLELREEEASGRMCEEVIRNSALLELVEAVRETGEKNEAEISVERGGKRTLQATAVPLRRRSGETGVLVVLNDVTRLREVDRIRKDFVANVSHELKTPITAVKGFAETLLDGALDDPDSARRFTGIIARHADRMEKIVEDLLTLSRLEQDTGEAQIRFEPVSADKAARSAAEACAAIAKARDVEIVVDSRPGLTVRGNPQLIEQALINLIDNAIKYSEDGGRVYVSCRKEGGEILLSVKDEGCGIAREHISRIFERFYRVDKARSRKLGGTGLGLAIVKHVAQLHGGRVEVESAPGKGSTFTMFLPARDGEGRA